jgi:hypothetical protein
LKVNKILSGERPDYDWPINVSPGFIKDNGWFATGRAFIKAILCLYAFQQPKSFADSSIVRISNDWLKQANSRNYHHFFPRAYLRGQAIDDSESNNIVNITIVDDYLNKRRIRDKPPSQYLQEFGKENKNLSDDMKTHLIDDLDGFGVRVDDYELFLQMRSERVSQELRKRVILTEQDERVHQPVRMDDLEEEAAGFE